MGTTGWRMGTWHCSLRGRHALTDQNKSTHKPAGMSQLAFVSIPHGEPQTLERLRGGCGGQWPGRPARGRVAVRSLITVFIPVPDFFAKGVWVYTNQGAGDKGACCWLCSWWLSLLQIAQHSLKAAAFKMEPVWALVG